MRSDIVVLERIWPPFAAPPGLMSQIGGWPNLPGDLPWPRIRFKNGSSASLDFLAQIDLAELPAVSRRARLPETGTLYFFALSQSDVPLRELGPEAARVLYWPAGSGAFAPRPPPADAGWNQDELYHVRSTAAEFRATGSARGELFPRCPVRLRPAMVVDNRVVAEVAPPRGVEHPEAALPYRVEDALLLINFARNHWRENIVPLAALRARAMAAARYHLRWELMPQWIKDWRRRRYRYNAALRRFWFAIDAVCDATMNQAAMLRYRLTAPARRPGPAHFSTVLSGALWSRFAGDYQHWRDEAAALWHRLADLGRASILDQDRREAVHATLAEADRLLRRIGINGVMLQTHEMRTVAKMSLASLLLDYPEVAAQCPDEVAATHPSLQHWGSHRMLGPPHDIQGGTMDGPHPVLLLQLDTDKWGPRFSWWDAGNITFWISAKDAAEHRFDKARAEIEAH